MGDKAYYTAFYNEIVNNPKAIAAIYAYLMQRTVQKHYNGDDIPISAYQSKLRAANRDTAERFVEHIVSNEPMTVKTVEKKAEELKEEYCTVFRKDDAQYRTDQVMRTLELGGISGVTKRCTTKGKQWVTLYQFDLEKLRKHFGHGVEEKEDKSGPIDIAVEMMSIEQEVRRAFGLVEEEVTGAGDTRDNESEARRKPAQHIDIQGARDDDWLRHLGEARPEEEHEPMEHEKRLEAAKRKMQEERAAAPPPKVARKSVVPDLFAQRLTEKGIE
eukprot:2920872-Prymnesium_polylepis.1